ncbi:uncharacterized protein F5Z01DRAFT_654761 [Emericellopsis atlantica]|uniref:DUF2293 domain-containing protein n=1 Tax=Emericellopsis atlantica TaxID=2614577 RepID=A0A9P7ZN46_9HYPO|nr:uncharacterized protein F5Z01DRAFT_654761 [Emericellopsis atlantica]KAG9254752.1 hypothetical protein F5Z01DRAFT_654761 [Emericellopsis atlantica]
MPASECEVDVKSQKPKGYGFLAKGNPYKTGICRRLTHASGRKLYVVKGGNKIVGLRAPHDIISKVHQQDKETKATRRAAVERRDGATEATFKEAILKDFPKIPEDSLRTILQHTLKKRSGRVGRTGTRDMTSKVRLAVTAHIRHKYTDYDTLLKRNQKRMQHPQARQLVHPEIVRILRDWRGGKATRPPKSKQTAPTTHNKKQDTPQRAQSAEKKNPSTTKTASHRPNGKSSVSSGSERQEARRLPSVQPAPGRRLRVQTRSMRALGEQNRSFEQLDVSPNDKDNPIVLDSSASEESEAPDNCSDFDSLDGFIVQDGFDDSDDDDTDLELRLEDYE